jgi:hypothetical protein
VATLLSAAVAASAGCGGGGGAGTATEPVPPDRLSATLAAAGAADFRLDLDCAVADREACAGILEAIAAAEDDRECSPAPEDDATILVSGTIAGDAVRALLGRRTDCEIRTYDAVVTALGL